MTHDEENPERGRDDVATLLRVAGRRPAVPRERAERVREVARRSWQSQVRRGTRRHFVWAAAALATAAVLVLALVLRLDSAGPGPTSHAVGTIHVALLAGSAWLRGAAGELQPLGPADTLPARAELVTEQDGRIALRLDSGHSVRLDRSTSLRFLDSGTVVLERGAIYVDSGTAGATTGGLSVHTPFGIVQEIGTQFEVRLDARTVRVLVREGQVSLEQQDRRHEISIGRGIELGPTGATTTWGVSTHGPEWDWLTAVTPMGPIEGRSAADFLEWAARERGWRLTYADDDVRRSAEVTVLRGTASGMTLDEALEAVLPTCRLSHRVTEGTLTIEALP